MYVVTATHPISLPGGRMAGPGEKVTNLKPSDPQVAALVDAGLLRKKKAPAKPKAATPEPEESTPAPATNETETN